MSKTKSMTVQKESVSATLSSYNSKGYVTDVYTDKMIKLTKKKKFQTGWFLFFLIVFFPVCLIVILSYIVDKDEELNIYINDDKI